MNFQVILKIVFFLKMNSLIKLSRKILLTHRQTMQSLQIRNLDDNKGPIKPEPASCCGSGCQNCAWLQYADELLAYYQAQDAKQIGIKKIMEEIEKIEDPNLKAYLKMEIHFKTKE